MARQLLRAIGENEDDQSLLEALKSNAIDNVSGLKDWVLDHMSYHPPGDYEHFFTLLKVQLIRQIALAANDPWYQPITYNLGSDEHE